MRPAKDAPIASTVGVKGLSRSTAVAVGVKVLGAAAALGVNLIVARLLGAADAGLYFLAATTMTIGTVFGRLGLDNAVLRFVSEAVDRADLDGVKATHHRANMVSLVASLGAGALLILFAPLFARLFSAPALTAPLRWMAAGIVPTSLVMLHGEGFKALRRPNLGIAAKQLFLPVATIVAMLAMVPTWGVDGAGAAYLVAAMATLAVTWSLWPRDRRPFVRTSGESVRSLLHSSIPLFWFASLNLVMTFSDTVLLGILGSTTDVSIYTVAAKLALLTTFVMTGIESIVAPRFSGMLARGEHGALRTLAIRATSLATGAALPIIAILVAAGPWVLRAFGPAFPDGAAALAILACGQLVNVMTGSVGYLLIMSGRERDLRNNVLVAAVSNVVLNLCLIPALGISGAAIATATSIVVMNLLSLWKVRRFLGFLVLPFMRTAPS